MKFDSDPNFAMNVRPLLGAASLLMSAAISSGCRPRTDAERSGAAQPDSTRSTEPAPAITPPLQDSVVPVLETGCAGGVTGGGSGTFVTADGRFYRYQREGPPPNAPWRLTFVRRDSARSAGLVEAAEREGITRIKYSQPSNMTCYLSLTRNGTEYEVAWPISTTPPAIRGLVALAKDLSAAAEGR